MAGGEWGKAGNYRGFYYALKGNKNKPILLFLHGFMGKGNDFDPVISELDQEFCCLVVDLPGHGKTLGMAGEDCYGMSPTALGLMGLLAHLKVDRCFLVGYSMGGRLALYLTLGFPDQFERVVLESTSPGLKTKQERSLRRVADERLAKELETGDFKAFLMNWYHQPLFQALHHSVHLHPLIERRLHNNPQELAKSLRQMGTGNQPSLWEKLKDNRVPLLLLVGEYDQKFRGINTEMIDYCPSAQLHIIPETGHTIHLENKTAWITQVKQFFRAESVLNEV